MSRNRNGVIAAMATRYIRSLDSNSCSIDVMKIASKLNVKVIEHEFGEELISVLATKNKIDWAIGVSSKIDEKKRRVAIMNCLSHILLDHNIREILFIDKKDSSFNVFEPDTLKNKEANLLSAYILIPTERLNEEIENFKHKGNDISVLSNDLGLIIHLSNVFNVTASMVLFRLMCLGSFGIKFKN